MKRKNRNQIILFLGLTYLLVTGVLVFVKPKKVSNDYTKKTRQNNSPPNADSSDRIIILDEPSLSGLARLKIIKEAQETLNISYFSIETGESPDLFLLPSWRPLIEELK